MISEQIILELYREYPEPSRDFSSLDMEEFLTTCRELYGITLDATHITFGKMESDNPFRSILLRNLCGIVYFEHHIAMITPSYILFFARAQYSVEVHFKPDAPSLWNRLRKLGR